MTDKQSPELAATSKPGDQVLLDKIKSTPLDEAWECSCCLQTLPFQDMEWLEELETLLAKYAGEMGISPNLAGFSIAEQWWNYKTLKGFEDRHARQSF